MFKVMQLMVRWLLVACALILLANAAPFDKDSEAKILKNKFIIDEKGNYRFSFVTSNGMTRDEIGKIVNEGQPNEHISVIGRYTYFNIEGNEETIEYRAGEDGYNVVPSNLDDLSVPPNVVATLLG